MFPTRTFSPNRLLVFARMPEAGCVKTRLANDIGADRALVLYHAMLQDLLDSIGNTDEQTSIEVVWTGSDSVSGRAVRELFAGYDTATQAGRNLGERLLLAFNERIIFYAAEKVMAIGTDDPTIPRATIDKGFDLLDSCDWVIGPASDGGYYLIGCRAASFDLRVFQNVAWGTGQVLKQTLQSLRELGETVALLPQRDDLDVVDDVRRFSRAPFNHEARRTHAVLREWGWVA